MPGAWPTCCRWFSVPARKAQAVARPASLLGATEWAIISTRTVGRFLEGWGRPVSRKDSLSGGIQSGALGRVARAAWRGLGSESLAVWLLLATALLALLGTCLPQSPWLAGHDAAEAARWYAAVESRYGPSWADLLQRLGLLDLYHSRLFLGTLGLLTLSGLVCTVQRVGRQWRIFRARPRPAMPRGDVGEEGLVARIVFRGDSALAERAVRGACRKARLRVRFGPAEEGVPFVAEGERWFALGTVVAHLGLVLVALGLLLGALAGFRVRTPPVAAGQAYPLPSVAGVSLFVGELEIERYADGQPRAYQVPVALLGEDGRVWEGGWVRLGAPLSLPGGVAAYLYAFGPAVQVSFAGVPGMEERAIALAPTGSTPLGGGRWLVVARAPEPGRYHVQLWEGDELLEEGTGAAEEILDLAGVPVRLTPSRYVILELVRDPGFPWVVAGALLGLVGAAAALGVRWRLVRGYWRDGELVLWARASGVGSPGPRTWSRLIQEVAAAGQGHVVDSEERGA